MEKIALLLLFATLLTAEVLAYKQKDLDRLRDTHNCVKCDLRGAILREANLIGANLYRADLRKADLRKADLRDSNLGDTNLRGVNAKAATWTLRIPPRGNRGSITAILTRIS